MFHNLSDIIDHKKHYCKLRFTCKCAPKISGCSENDGRDSGMDFYDTKGRISMLSPSKHLKNFRKVHQTLFTTGLFGSDVVLLCSSCNESFLHPWDLLVHVQKTHSLHIYDDEDSSEDNPFGLSGLEQASQQSSSQASPSATTAPTVVH